MRPSEDWLSYFDSHSDLEFVRLGVLVRKIQADVLRYAANMSGDGKNIVLLAMADELDPQPPHPKP